MRLDGRRVLVTGAAGGIGSAIVRRLAADGAQVVATDLAIAAPGVACDIRDRSSVDALVQEGAPLWGVVHTAARCGGSGPFERVTARDFADYLDTNLVGAFNVLQSAALAMIESGTGGRLIAIGSINALAAEPEVAPYASSKGGLRMLVKAAAVDLARHGIAASLIHPGPITVARNSDLFADPSLERRFTQYLPMGAPGKPEDVAAAAAYLLDPAAGFTTGAEIVVDGGLLASVMPDPGTS